MAHHDNLQNLLAQFESIVAQARAADQPSAIDIKWQELMKKIQTDVSQSALSLQSVAMVYAKYNSIMAAGFLLAAGGFTLFDLINRHPDIPSERKMTDTQISVFVNELSLHDLEHLVTTIGMRLYLLVAMNDK